MVYHYISTIRAAHQPDKEIFLDLDFLELRREKMYFVALYIIILAARI